MTRAGDPFALACAPYSSFLLLIMNVSMPSLNITSHDSTAPFILFALRGLENGIPTEFKKKNIFKRTQPHLSVGHQTFALSELLRTPTCCQPMKLDPAGL